MRDFNEKTVYVVGGSSGIGLSVARALSGRGAHVVIFARAKLTQPDAVARALIKGMEQRKFLIIPGFDGKLTFAVKRLFPWLVDWMMSRDIRKAQRATRSGK